MNDVKLAPLTLSQLAFRVGYDPGRARRLDDVGRSRPLAPSQSLCVGAKTVFIGAVIARLVASTSQRPLARVSALQVLDVDVGGDCRHWSQAGSFSPGCVRRLPAR
jgi:hypothetical protein